MQTLRLILGDQLNHQHSWFPTPQSDVLYVIAELHQETAYVSHHAQKVCAFFAAMRDFAQELNSRGHRVLHLTLDDTSQFDNLPEMLSALCHEHSIDFVEYQRPDEYRLRRQLDQMDLGPVDCREVDSEHFLLHFDELPDYFHKSKSTRMEPFYRKMRVRFDYLMDGTNPEGSQWNYDASNRNRLATKDLADLPEPLLFSNDVSRILKRLERHGVETIGKSLSTLPWPVNREQGLMLLDYFCTRLLPHYGRFQDAMTANSKHRWSLYHSRLSFLMNVKLLSPREVIDSAMAAYRQNSAIDIAQIEGFIRQILGWREFIRGVYWINMPDYAAMNALGADGNLPKFFWTGDTNMRCLQHAIGDSLRHAYAHHIQRLMLIGNYAMLCGIAPDEIDSWYLGIYIDAIEWVEMPNTRGMSQFADGGLVGSKPYAAGGNYINKMSDYCSDCKYDVKQRTDENSCPFNSLYWDFINRHAEQLIRNPRASMAVRTFNRFDDTERQSIQDRATWCRDHQNSL